MLQDEVKASSLFLNSTNAGERNTELRGNLSPEGATFTFTMHLALKNPLKL
jgi:hypothetical protein